MMHAGMHCLKVIDDRKWPLAFLLQKPGDTCLYTYDLGDFFEHTILLEEVYTGQYVYNIILIVLYMCMLVYVYIHLYA